MKNLKNYFILSLLTLTLSTIFLACSQENGIVEEKKIENVNLKKALSSKTATIQTAAIQTATIACYISGSTVTNANTNIASSSVNAGTTTTYQYNSNPTVTNIQWVIVQGTGISFIGSTTSSIVTVSFSSTFTGGSIQAIGTDSTGQICGPVLPIINTNGGIGCCNPTFDAFYICDGTAKGKGAVVPFVNGCDVSTISSIVWNLGGAEWVAGPLAGQSGGTMLPPFNQYSKNIGYYQCQYGMFQISATYNFNNGCPPKTYNLDVTPSN